MVSYINASINTLWHLDKKTGGSRPNQDIPQSGQKPSFSTDSVSLIKFDRTYTLQIVVTRFLIPMSGIVARMPLSQQNM